LTCSFLEDQCVRLKIPLKWPDSLAEFNISMKNLREDKNISEQNLFDEIVADVGSNTAFTKDQLARLKGFEEDLNKLEEQRAVLEACGDILAKQKILPKQNQGKIFDDEDDSGTQMV
jgi:hypothetical protein